MRISKRMWICVGCLLGGAAAAGQTSAVETQLSAAARQRGQAMSAMAASVRKQLASLSGAAPAPPAAPADPPDFFLTDSAFAPEPSQDGAIADCDALPSMMVQALADGAARENRIGADLVLAVMRQESGYRPCAVSPKGALGLMQLMPETAADLGVDDAFDARENVRGGARLLRRLLDRYAGNVNLALGAYNAGPARVDEYGGVPPFPETLHYVDAILRNLEAFPAPR